jgi:hypothetical protein
MERRRDVNHRGACWTLPLSCLADSVLYSQDRIAEWPPRPSRIEPKQAVVHIWSTCHRSPAVRNGLQRCTVRPGRRRDPGETDPGAEP